MKTIRVASYKNWTGFFSRLIQFKQKWINKLPARYCKYSHTELDFGVESFSSSELDGGVRFKIIKWKPENWDFISLEITDAQYKTLYKYAQKQDWNSYWWLGIFFAQTFNLNIKGSNTFFCSEIVTKLLQLAHVSDRICFESALFITPWQLLYLLEWGDHIITND